MSGSRASAQRQRLLSAICLRPLDQLDLVAVRVLHEGDYRGAAFDRAGLASDGAPGASHPVARNADVRHADGDVAEGGAKIVAVYPVVVGQLQHRVFTLVSIAHE